MKTKKYFLMAVAGMLALSGCSNDDKDMTPRNAPREMTFTAGYNDGATTRTTLDGDTYNVSFNAGDGISIFSANNDNVKFTTSAGGATATFTGTATEGDPTYFAIYPYIDGLSLVGTTIQNVWIPSTQDVSAGWDPRAPIAFATTTGSSLTFHNACALLKIYNDSGDNNTIFILETSGEGTLAGKYALDTTTGIMSVQAGQESYEVMAVNVPNNTMVYIAIAPGTIGYLSVTEFNHGGHKEKETPFTFEAGKIYYLGMTSSWSD